MDYVGLFSLNIALALMAVWLSRPLPLRVLVPVRSNKRIFRRR